MFERFKQMCRPSGLLALLIAAAAAVAWANRFVQDDAFISFRYAKNLAEGNGLVWNVGERVEGYTNFLWTLCLAPAFRFGWEIVSYSYALSLAAYVATLLLSYWVAREIWQSRGAGLWTALLLATNYSFSSYATGGLETQFGVAWVMLSVALLMRLRQRGCLWGALAGVSCACAVMTRMDAVLLVGPVFGWVAWQVWRDRDAACGRRLVAAAMAAGLLVAAWLIWRKTYYGAWVPNTFLIKATSPGWVRGTYYVCLFYGVYGLWLPVLVWARRAAALLGRCTEVGLGVALGTALLLWHLYVMFVGGDFMEFRLLMPSLPIVMVLVAGVCVEIANRWKGALAAWLMVLSGVHGLAHFPYPGIQTVQELKDRHDEWVQTADALSRAFGRDGAAVKIGVTCAGIIPYYTGFPAVDLLGLNDREIAKNGEMIVTQAGWFGNRPGHVRMASWDMIVDRRVNLLINTPWLPVVSERDLAGWKACDVLRNWFWDRNPDPSRANAAMVRFPFERGDKVTLPKVIAWPVGESRYCITVYVTESPVVERAIARSGARVIR